MEVSAAIAGVGKEVSSPAQCRPIHPRFPPDCCLAIELDGEGHFTESGVEADLQRTEFLHQKGIRVLRFENRRVFHDLDFVLAEIERNLIS